MLPGLRRRASPERQRRIFGSPEPVLGRPPRVDATPHREVGVWGSGLKSPKPSASQSLRSPETKQEPLSHGRASYLVSTLGVFVSFPHSLKNPSGEGRDKRKNQERSAPRSCSGGPGPPARGQRRRLCSAGPGALGLPQNYPACAATSSFYRFAGAGRGVTIGQSLFPPARSPPSSPAFVFVAQSLRRKHVEPRPAP